MNKEELRKHGQKPQAQLEEKDLEQITGGALPGGPKKHKGREGFLRDPHDPKNSKFDRRQRN